MSDFLQMMRKMRDDDGEPEREERGKRASPASAAGHGYSKYSSAFLARGQRAPPSTLSGASRFQANLSCTRRVECTKGPEAPMIRPKSLRQLAAYSISLPAFAISPKMAKETVYMPSQVAAQVLGNGAKKIEPAVNRNERDNSERNGNGRI